MVISSFCQVYFHMSGPLRQIPIVDIVTIIIIIIGSSIWTSFIICPLDNTSINRLNLRLLDYFHAFIHFHHLSHCCWVHLHIHTCFSSYFPLFLDWRVSYHWNIFLICWLVLYFLMVGWFNESYWLVFISHLFVVSHIHHFPRGRSTTHNKSWIQMVWCLFVSYIEARGDLYFILVFFIKGFCLDLGISHLRRSKLASSGHQPTPLGEKNKQPPLGWNTSLSWWLAS